MLKKYIELTVHTAGEVWYLRLPGCILHLVFYNLHCFYYDSGKCNVTVWRPSVWPSVCLSVCPVGILTVTHQGAACGTASVHFGQTIRGTDILVRYALFRCSMYVWYILLTYIHKITLHKIRVLRMYIMKTSRVSNIPTPSPSLDDPPATPVRDCAPVGCFVIPAIRYVLRVYRSICQRFVYMHDIRHLPGAGGNKVKSPGSCQMITHAVSDFVLFQLSIDIIILCQGKLN